MNYENMLNNLRLSLNESRMTGPCFTDIEDDSASNERSIIQSKNIWLIIQYYIYYR